MNTRKRKPAVKRKAKRHPSVRVAAKRKGKRNPQYSLEAKPDARVRSMTHEFKVPTKTLANLAMRGFVQEQGGGNPNAYTYKLTKLGLAKWRVEAVPKIKAATATVKAFTAGSATRKFKRTLKGPKNMYEVSVQRNPKRKTAKRKNSPSDFALAGRISRQIVALEKKRETTTTKAQIKKLQAYLAKVYERAYAAERAKDAAILEAPRSFSTATRKRATKKKANPHKRKPAVKTVRRNTVAKWESSSGHGAIARQIFDLSVEERNKNLPLLRRFIKVAKEEGISKDRIENWLYGKFYIEKDVIAKLIPKRKPKKNSFVGSIKKAVKKVFKRKNDGSADREDFAGKVSGFKDLYFPPGTPQGLSTLGPLVHIETDKANIKPAKGMAVLCQDSNHRLYVGSATPNAAAYTGSESLKNQNLGKVQRIEYRCSKPHLGEEYRGNITWYHDFEAPLPTLKTDSDGRFIFSGGNYSIKREGIVG